MSLLATILAAAEAGSEHVAEAGGHAAEEEHKSETPFFVVGGVLVAFAIAISVIGMKKPDFPASGSAARGVMALSAALVLATMVSIIYVSA